MYCNLRKEIRNDNAIEHSLIYLFLLPLVRNAFPRIEHSDFSDCRMSKKKGRRDGENWVISWNGSSLIGDSFLEWFLGDWGRLWWSLLESGGETRLELCNLEIGRWKKRGRERERERFDEIENDRNMIFRRTRETKLKSNV